MDGLKLKNIRMNPKMIGLFLLVGLVPIGIVGYQSTNKAEDALMTSAFNQLEGVRGIKQARIQNFFVVRKGDLGVLIDFAQAFPKLGSENKSGANFIALMKAELATYYTGQFGVEYASQNDDSTSLANGVYAETDFGGAFRLATESDDLNSMFLADYARYTPCYEATASFISSPI